jgi:transposase
MRMSLAVAVRRLQCQGCRMVKPERLQWLADNPFYTKRCACYGGRRCRASTVQDVSKEWHLNGKTVKQLKKQYMREQLRRTGAPGPKVSGIDEVSIRRGQTYRIVVSDLRRRRPSWFGGNDRSEDRMDVFFQWLGPRKSQRIRLAVLDRWKAFRNSTVRNAPQASILFDTLYVMRHLGEAHDKVRKSESARLSGKDRRFITGQKYTLLPHREHLTLDGRRALKVRLRANQRLNTASLLKESFDQLWDYQKEGWARRFFDNWCASLTWQRLGPYEKFAAMIERHWDGIAAFCKPENTVALGFVVGLNHKVRVIQRRAYGLSDEACLRLKVLTCLLPAL